MSTVGTNLVQTQTKAVYVAQSAALVGQAFDSMLSISESSVNIFDHLTGPVGSGKPFAMKQDLTKGAMDKVNYSVGAPLGQTGRRGPEQAVNFEEKPRQSSWNVQIDTLRVVVGWSEITKRVATTGETWQEVYSQLVGERMGQIKQEDMLMRLRMRSSARNTVRPGNRSTLNTIHYDDTLDTDALGRAINLASRNAKPATVGKSSSGMDIQKYIALGGSGSFSSIWQDPAFVTALQHAGVDGSENPLWTGDLPEWQGTALKRWNIVTNDTPGPLGASIEPEGVLGDAIVGATTALTVYGGGVTQAGLGADQTALYTPFAGFYGCDYRFGFSLSVGADTTQYNFIVLDPADGKWCLYEYNGSTGINANGASITCTKRLAAATSGTAFTTVGDWTYDASVNKVDFPTGSIIVQVNSRVVPVGDMYVFGSDAGAFCYGSVKDKRIQEMSDYGALVGKGVMSDYGCDLRVDTQGIYRGYVRLQVARQLVGYTLPSI